MGIQVTVEKEHVIHDTNSSDLSLDANLDTLTYTNLRGDGQSTDFIVDADENVIPTPVRGGDDFIDDANDDVHVIGDSESEDLNSNNYNEVDSCSSDESY